MMDDIDWLRSMCNDNHKTAAAIRGLLARLESAEGRVERLEKSLGRIDLVCGAPGSAESGIDLIRSHVLALKETE